MPYKVAPLRTPASTNAPILMPSTPGADGGALLSSHRNGRNHIKVEQLSDLALDCIHSAARALEFRYRPAFYGEVAKGLEAIETDALFTICGLVASAQRQVTRATIG